MGYIVALTGGIGSGKSTVASAFARYGVLVVDTDVIARQVVDPGTLGLFKIVSAFGNKILIPGGLLNRAAMRQMIFNCPEIKIWLNKLLHPLIFRESQRQLAKATSPYTIWVVPLLVESGLHSYVDRVLVVDVNIETQLFRTAMRDCISIQDAYDITCVQATRAQRLAIADDVIENDIGSLGIDLAVATLHHLYLQLSRSLLYNT